MTKLLWYCLLELIVGVSFGYFLSNTGLHIYEVLSICLILFIFSWINYEIGKEVKDG